MKKLLFSILSAFMVSTMASAQYLNVKMDDGTYRSFKTSSKTEVDFGAKKEIGTINGHAFIELAGYKWATENVGCIEKGVRAVGFDPTYGLYYAQKVDDVEYAKLAAESWGGTWTLPSEKQWQALIDSCYWEWTDSYNYLNSPYNGKPGCIVYQTKSDDDKNQLNKENSGYTPVSVAHLFLPAAGRSVSSVFEYQGIFGYYWSTGGERCLGFGSSYRTMGIILSFKGTAVRPVAE